MNWLMQQIRSTLFGYENVSCSLILNSLTSHNYCKSTFYNKAWVIMTLKCIFIEVFRLFVKVLTYLILCLTRRWRIHHPTDVLPASKCWWFRPSLRTNHCCRDTGNNTCASVYVWGAGDKTKLWMIYLFLCNFNLLGLRSKKGSRDEPVLWLHVTEN